MKNLTKHEEVYRGELFKEFAKPRILVCGAGALGSNLVDNLVRQGVTNIQVLDMDRVEEQNIGTQRYGFSDIGAMKVEALKNQLYRATKVEISTIDKELNEGNLKKFLRGADLLVDCFDNAASRKLLAEQTFVKNVLHTGLYADYGEIVWNERYTVPKDVEGDVCDYPLARNIIMLTVTVATEVILRYITHKQKNSFAITLKDMKITGF